jgi:hypothetical protein
MKRSSLKSGSLVVFFVVGLCYVFGLSSTGAGEVALHKSVAVKGKRVVPQEGEFGYDEECLKRRLGVKSLRGANLSGRDLRWLYLQEADLSKANLQGANLKGINLRKAKLRGADLQGADLSGANLKDVDLCGADLTGSENLVIRQIITTVYDKETKFPDGLTFRDIPKYNKDSLMSALGVKMLEGAEAKGMQTYHTQICLHQTCVMQTCWMQFCKRQI